MDWTQEYAQLTEELRRRNSERYYHLSERQRRASRAPLAHDAVDAVIASFARRKLSDTRRAASKRQSERRRAAKEKQ